MEPRVEAGDRGDPGPAVTKVPARETNPRVLTGVSGDRVWARARDLEDIECPGDLAAGVLKGGERH